uniref:Uncharacterized protein n=1 Tax=Globodera rostochiensis TaxID=31243 RepID=A0A914I9V2_GLORO
MSPVPVPPPMQTVTAPTAQSPSSSVITFQPTEQLSLSPTMSPEPVSPPMQTVTAPTAQSPSSSVITIQPMERPLSLSPTMSPPLIATALAPTQQSLPSSSLTASAIHLTKRKKLMLFAASIFNSIFFEELNRQLLIEDITELVILEKQQKQQFSIDEVVKIINHEKVPKLAILRISQKLGVPKSRATLLYTESKRKTASEHQEKATGKRKREPSDGEDDDGGSNKASFPSKQKYQNPKALMPWRPYRKVLPPDVRNSVLSCEDHRNYVAILQNLLTSDPTFRFEHDMKKIKAWDEMLNEERQLYLDTTLRTIKSWKTYPNSLFVYPEAPSLIFVMNHHIMKSRCLIGERAFQGVLLEIPWTNAQQQQSVAFRFNVSVLRPGHGKSLKIPDIRQRFMIKLNHKDIEKKISTKLKQKLSITADIDLRNFAIQNDIEVVMDGSTLCHFLSAPYGHKPQISYACRVSVELEFRGGKMRRVCSVFPPIIASRMHRPFVAREYFKWAIKLQLRDSEQKKDDEKGQKKLKMDESAESLLNELQLGEIGKTAGSSSAGVGKRYAIVTFDGDQQSEFDQHRVLIRTGVHGTENTRVVSLAVRPEFLPEIAAEKISAEETLMDVVTATLKGSQEHLTLRVHFDEQLHQLHLIQIDRKKASDLSRLSQESRKLLSSRIQRFCSLLDALRELNAGEYLLIHDDETVRLVQERNVRQSKKERDSDNESDELNLYIEDEGEENAESDVLSSGPVYDFAWFEHVAKMKPVFSHAPIDDYWNGIDPHYPLQWHIGFSMELFSSSNQNGAWCPGSFLLEMKPCNELASLFVSFPQPNGEGAAEPLGVLRMDDQMLEIVFGDQREVVDAAAEAQQSELSSSVSLQKFASWADTQRRLMMCKVKAEADCVTFVPKTIGQLEDELAQHCLLREYVERIERSRTFQVKCRHCGHLLHSHTKGDFELGVLPYDDWLDTAPQMDYFCEERQIVHGIERSDTGTVARTHCFLCKMQHAIGYHAQKLSECFQTPFVSASRLRGQPAEECLHFE